MYLDMIYLALCRFAVIYELPTRDHVGGNEELRDYLLPNTPFIGGDERIPALNTLVHDNHILPVRERRRRGDNEDDKMRIRRMKNNHRKSKKGNQ